MTLELFALCDFAQEEGGKLTVLGLFDTLCAREFPANHALCCVAARLRFSVYELGNHDLRFSIRDADGRELIPPFEGSITVDGIGIDSAASNIALRLTNIPLPGEGRWRASLAVDGNEVGQIPLYIRGPR
ncbi:MAG: hypothetical protein JNG85_14605 [Spirochaetaceae bacterium]|nr:hypothetical protein [Spirochaetaceae bacterium]